MIPSSPLPPMTPFRRQAVSLLVLAVIALTLAPLLRQESGWPFCDYPMFSAAVAAKKQTRLAIYSVRDNTESFIRPEHPLFFRDFDGAAAERVLKRILSRESPPAEKSRRFLDLLLGELRRQAAADSLPPPTGLRVYTITRSYGDPDRPETVKIERDFFMEYPEEVRP